MIKTFTKQIQFEDRIGSLAQLGWFYYQIGCALETIRILQNPSENASYMEGEAQEYVEKIAKEIYLALTGDEVLETRPAEEKIDYKSPWTLDDEGDPTKEGDKWKEGNP